MKRKPLSRFAVVLLGLVLFGGTAQAVAPVHQNQIYEIPLQLPHRLSAAEIAVQGVAREAVASVRSAYGGDWRVASWNPQTGTPSYLIGSGADIAPAFINAADVTRAAEAVIAAHPAAFGADPRDLRLISAPRALGKWAVHYQQTYAGLDVWGGGAHLTFTDAGRLFAMGSSCYPGITVDPHPTLGATQAEGIATGDLPYYPPDDYVEPGTDLLVLPVALGQAEVSHHLVWRVRVHTTDPLGTWVTHVDAHSGEILWRYNDIHFVDFGGTADADVEPATYCNGLEAQPLAYMRVEVDGVGTTTTDVDGAWTVGYGGSDSHRVIADLYGPYINVNNTAGSDAEYDELHAPGGAIPIVFDDSNSQRDERDCFDAINDIHDFISLFDPDFSYINQRITCNVSLNQTCNAYWDGTINFYREGGGCANTGQIQGVVHHEFGHGIQHTILGSQGNEGLGEGNSDIIANLMTQESIIGRGFYLDVCGSGIRDSDNTLWYPEDMNGSIHHDGQIIAGFHWDFMELMQAEYGPQTGTVMAAERWHFGRILERPFYQPDQVLATAVADDDDGNLENGTPHYDYIWTAAENHGFHRYIPEAGDIIFVHTPVPTTTEAGDVDVVAEIYSNHGCPLVAETILLHYRVDADPGDPFTEVQMLPTGEEDMYQATIPDLTVPSEVEYYLSAEDEQGHDGTSPRSAPVDVYAFDVATIYDPLESETGWVVNLEGGDDATTGVWERVDPVGTEAQPEDDHTPDGTICWVTGNAEPGQGMGTNDVDGGTTTVYSPEYDLSDSDSAVAKYYRWYSNDKGADPNNDLWVVQVRNNGGGWVDIENTQDDQNRWHSVEADLLALFPDDLGIVQLKFVASDLHDGSVVEAAVDDFVILAEAGFSDAPDAVRSGLRFALHGGRVNPAPGGTEIRFQVPSTTHVDLTLFDISGRNVRSLASDAFGPGMHTVSWDGRDEAGRALAAGVYYVRMQSPGFQATRTLVLSR
ncbi:MAG: T9SS type A sorting domain-containing protein [Candidatus Eisenbacteria bacterium]|nr:T9SS type A sorting domain-containing protein [Candidatus Eisenbacteria bacterium]